ncbi:MAG: pyruvate ferredoxin oxidoreductase [Candidatus Omnitrophica bacterium CG07_land_8_20_14_0_80_42_15]|uniref:Pyruvate ferredoxin oxidoreductase n=1 Tax=Candidatus Aquitaenariimonas noxiae TaxID=1974741 RepID=A0A2J0KV73_9BACT|nr:MAG: pyruvate ferredoxin oxidoreductase [Candidatus Omnitrophica bacterium CG07_land_8_20_14_0_80_42_15]
MKEIRIHARAGQGAITTAMLLGEAVFAEDKYALAFPYFGAARMGAPMNAFVRINDKPIRLRSQIYEPDYIIVVDATLLRGFDVFKGLKKGGIAIINKREGIQAPKIKDAKIYEIPANDIAQKILGRPLGNTALLGAFAAATGEVELKSLEAAVVKRFPGKMGEKNAEAVKAGFEAVSKEKK